MKVPLKSYLPAVLISLVPALWLAAPYRNYMPMPDGWATFETILLPLSSLDVVFHEAGHWIFGVLGVDFIRVAGGTLMQLLLPAACLIHFILQKNPYGL